VISLADARLTVFRACPVSAPELVTIDAALGCVLATALTAPVSVPSFTNSAVDGFAVRAADVVDVPVELATTDTVMAGSVPSNRLEPGQAMRIMTGAPLPDGADAVCMVEHTTEVGTGHAVAVLSSVTTGANVRHPGEDIAAGQALFDAGTELGAAHIGVLASVGLEQVTVHRRLRVGVLSTGDEITPSGRSLAPGKIWDANRPLLLAAVRSGGFDTVDLGIAPDDEDALIEAFGRGAERCDAILTSGGVSMGERDVVKVVLERLASDSMRWMQIAIKPAKPFAFGVLADSDTPVFGLPGNPVSSLVSFELLARPALRRMAGHRRIDRSAVSVTATAELSRRPDGKTHNVVLMAGVNDDEIVNFGEFAPSTPTGSGAVTAWCRAIGSSARSVRCGRSNRPFLRDPTLRRQSGTGLWTAWVGSMSSPA
jgi:molybdenum cofactor synthesis domain-containing protein